MVMFIRCYKITHYSLDYSRWQYGLVCGMLHQRKESLDLRNNTISSDTSMPAGLSNHALQANAVSIGVAMVYAILDKYVFRGIVHV